MRRVDNIVSVLDSALQRTTQQAAASTQPSVLDSLPLPKAAPNTLETQKGATKASPEELSTTTQGQRLLDAEANADLNAKRHGRGPKQGDLTSARLPSGRVKTLGEEARLNGTIKLIERWKTDMPTEAQMLPRDKYTMFDRKAKHYRKGVHSEFFLPRFDHATSLRNLTLFFFDRAAQVDEGVAETEPAGLLDCFIVYILYYIYLLALWLHVTGFSRVGAASCRCHSS